MGKRFAEQRIEDIIEGIKDYLGNSADLKISRLNPVRWLIFLEGLIDEAQLYQRIADRFLSDQQHDEVFTPAVCETLNLSSILADLTAGEVVLLEDEGSYVSLETIPAAGWQLRPIEEPVSEQLVRGPREGFTETISVNTAMVRRWIKDPHLRIDEMQIGERTQTIVRVLYLKNVADQELVQEVIKRLSSVEIDGILDSGYLEQLITDNRLTIFPLIQSTERSDKTVAAILEGRVAIMVDKSPFTLIVPTTINELYQSPEDYYFSFYLGSFLRIFRLLGNNIAVAFSGLYIALCSSNPELLPTSFAYSIAASRRGIPYPIFIEVLLLEIIVEVFREAGLRLPKNVNQTLGVVAGIGLAFAAVHAHLVSDASLVVVAIGAIASFSSPSFAAGISWRVFKFMLIFGAILMGIVGLALTGIMILGHAATLTSFGVSYLAPWAPVEPRELRDAAFREPFWMRRTRPKTYRPKERRRMTGKPNKEGTDR